MSGLCERQREQGGGRGQREKGGANVGLHKLYLRRGWSLYVCVAVSISC